MRFDDYAHLARCALSRDFRNVVMAVERVAANEKNQENARRLKGILDQYGGTRVDPDLRMLCETQPRHSLDDLVIPTDFWGTAENIRMERLKREELARHGIEPRSRILCSGNSGTGKTAYAHALARHLDLPLITVVWSQTMDSYLGNTNKLVDRMMEWIINNDCVLLMDEVDMILRERDDRLEIGEMKRVVCNLLPQLENSGSRCVLVATTNHPQCLDSASWRRFHNVLRFPDATRESLRAMLGKFVRIHKMDNEFDVSEFRNFPDMNFGEFANTLENALRLCIVHDEPFGCVLKRLLS